MKKDEEIVKELQQFGLTDKEALIYLSALALGPSSIQSIAKRSKLNRSTVHIISESLMQKGFFGETRRKKKRLIFAEDPDKIKDMLREQKYLIEMKERMLDRLMPSLQNIDVTQEGRPKMRFYEGEQGFYDVCQRSLDKVKDEILLLSSMKDFYDAASENYDNDYYIPTRKKKNVKMRMLAFEMPRTVELKKRDSKDYRETRFLSQEYKFKSSMFIYGDEFSMTTSKAPFLGLVVESKELCQMMRQVFEIIWNVSK
jgi:sugar-specific transcriptional regulator TrmB